MNASYSYDIGRADGSTGHFRIPIKVKGFWSGESITVYGDYRCYGSTGWKFTISHSSGGRDTKEVECDGEAAKNFGEAMIAAGNLVALLRSVSYINKLTSEYESALALRAEQERIERQARQERIDADPAIGESVAKEFLENLEPNEIVIAIKRGEEVSSYSNREFRVSNYGNRTYYKNGERISKKEAIKQLAEYSERSYVKNVH